MKAKLLLFNNIYMRAPQKEDMQIGQPNKKGNLPAFDFSMKPNIIPSLVILKRPIVKQLMANICKIISIVSLGTQA